MYRISIVAHQARADAAHALFDRVGSTHMAMDNGFWGCRRNHIKAWTYLADSPTEWALVVEDDAEPVDGFRTQMEQVLTAAPTSIVSLYLGRGYPPQLQERCYQATAAADREQACWIVADNHLHGVAVAIKTELIGDMLTWVRQSPQPIDYAIRDWARHHQHLIGFTHPSLVDHADTDSLAQHEGDGSTRTIPRKAWRVGTRDRWTRRQVPL